MSTELIIRIVVMAIIGGLIGYTTNVLAVKMLFKPIEPIKIPILNFEIIGLIPKRHKEISRNIAQIVSEELLSVDDIIDNFTRPEDKEKIKETIKERVGKIIEEKASTMLFPGIAAKIGEYVDQIIDNEMDAILDEMADDIKKKAKERINIKQMIEDKINSLDLLELEKMIISIAKKELNHIETLGLVLGLLIGTLQGVITIFL